jgi:uracil phosphoribosyltransferase
MAEALAKDMLVKAGIEAATGSAGVSVYAVGPASSHSLRVMETEKLDISAHRSRQVTDVMVSEATHVLTMTRGHQKVIRDLYPSFAQKVYTLSGYAGQAADISDPFGMDAENYKLCAGQIKNLLFLCVEKIKRELSMEKGKLHVTKHPLVQSKITMLRSVETGNKEFRELVEEVSSLICYEATYDLALTEVEVETPICKAKGMVCASKYGIVPILRAGLGMVEGVSNILPTAKIGHIGLYRDPESLMPVEYYCKLPPDMPERDIFLLDPMLATGNTVSKAVSLIKEKGGARSIKLLCLLAAPEGVKKLHSEHPEINIYAAAYDEEGLNNHGYIVPGLGDAGDRLFGTK